MAITAVLPFRTAQALGSLFVTSLFGHQAPSRGMLESK